MTKHTIKTIASGEYSCSCGAVWDRDEGDECPASKSSAELPGGKLNQPDDETFALSQWWFKELTAVAATADQRRALAVVSNLTHRYGAARLQAEKAGHLIEQMAQAIGANDEYGDFVDEIQAAEEFAAELILGNSPTGCTFCGSDEHMTAVCPMRANRPEVPPAVCEFIAAERQQLLDRIAELAALKARPSGVVLPERRPEVSGTWGDMGDAYSAGVNDTLDEVARLNSSPVSAGGVDERAAFEYWANTLSMRAYPLEWLDDQNLYSTQKANIAWQAWQARATLSAPSHGEQVLEAVLKRFIGAEPHLTEKVHYTCDAARDYRTYHLELYVPTPAKAPEPFEVAVAKWLGIAAAAPSAGSQGGDV